MAEQHPPPIGMARLITTAELARFETCRLAWWYDRTHPLARATPAEVTRRMEIFAAVYGPGVRDLPEYQLLTHWRDQPHTAAPEVPGPLVAPADKPPRWARGGMLVGLVIGGLLLSGVILAVVWR